MALAKAQDCGAPHWMRLLEDKYQRLHAKIVNQAARFSHRRRASLATTRVLRESQQRKHTSCSRVNAAADQDGLVNDQKSESFEVETTTLPIARQRSVEGLRFEHDHGKGEINGAILSSDCPPPYLRAKTAKSLSRCVIKQNGDHSINPRPQTQLGTRSSDFVDGPDGKQDECGALGSYSKTCYKCISNDFIVPTTTSDNNNNKVTPLSSGIVTRVSSAYPFTRLSSAIYDDTTNPSRPSPRIIVTTDDADQEIDAEQLNFALSLQLENQENDFEEKEEDFIFTATFPLEDLVENGQCYSRSCYGEQRGDSVMDVKCHTDRDDVTGRGRRRRRAVTRPVKTSVSRISHQTSKSCPATLLDIKAESGADFSNIGSIVDNNGNKNEFVGRRNINAINSNHLLIPSKPVVSLEPLTGKKVQTGRMRVFPRMSLEARHAIDETLKEMKTEEKLQQQQYQIARPSERDDDPSCVDESVNNFNNSADSIRNNVSVKTGDEQPTADQRLKPIVTDGKNHHNDDGDFSSDASILSNDSRTGFVSNKGLNNKNNRKDGIEPVVSRTKPPPYKDNNNNQIPAVSLDNKVNTNSSRRLPQIGENIDSFRDSFPTPHAPLPAIRQVNRTFRESTFEITPPDFDIRFREIITCQKGDRETPPLDVRQQSIDKCQQWLVRYTPRR